MVYNQIKFIFIINFVKMKHYYLLLGCILSIISCMFVGCNPSEPDDDINKARQMLIGEWALCKESFNIDTTAMSYDQLPEKGQQNRHYYVNDEHDTTYVYDIHNTQVVEFTKNTRRQGFVKKGEIIYSENGVPEDKKDYKLVKNTDGKVCVRIKSIDLSGYDRYLYYSIEYISSDSLFLAMADSLYFETNMGGVINRTHFHYKHPDTEYINNVNEKMSAAQRMMEGEWYSEKRVVVTEYEEGYAADNGETHTESTITYSGAYPALKINCEHVPATENQPSTFRKGTYSNGNATYDITPAKYNMDDEQQYIVSMDDDENFNVFFRCYQPQLLQNGKYTLSGFAPVVQTPTEDSMIMVADSLSYFYTQGVYSKMVITSRSRITEYWRRQ